MFLYGEGACLHCVIVENWGDRHTALVSSVTPTFCTLHRCVRTRTEPTPSLVGTGKARAEAEGPGPSSRPGSGTCPLATRPAVRSEGRRASPFRAASTMSSSVRGGVALLLVIQLVWVRFTPSPLSYPSPPNAVRHRRTRTWLHGREASVFCPPASSCDPHPDQPLH